MHSVTVSIDLEAPRPVISPEVYGHFAEHLGRCIYEGLWVGEDSEIPNVNGIRSDVVEALRALDIPVLRWPGGCFADEYHWKDGIGPREQRKSMYNSNWGGVVENNHFGTHEYFDLCNQLGCKTYVCGNIGSGTVQEMAEWVEYMTSPSGSPMANWRRSNGQDLPWKLDYFGVGNESWGCGGNMRPEYYADLYRRYNTYVRTYSENKIQRFACGANTTDYNWTRVLMENAATHMDGLSLHNYTLLDSKWPPSGSATEFDKAEWFSILRSAVAMDQLVEKHSSVMDEFDPEKRVGLIVDEWGTWHPVEPGTDSGFLYQQNTMRDAMVAALHLHIFHKHADRVTMANIAQTVNVLQAMVLTKGPEMLVTPSYWVFEMFKQHQGRTYLPLSYDASKAEGVPVVSIRATENTEGIFFSLACTSVDTPVEVKLPFSVDTVLKSRTLTAEKIQDHNSFENPEKLKPVDGASLRKEGDDLIVKLAPMSIVTVSFSSTL